MKIIIAVFIILGLVVLVSATSLVAYNYERVVIRERVITPEIHAPDLGFIEADCDKRKINITLSKNDALSFITPNEIYQEVEAPLREKCPDYKLTNIRNWNRIVWIILNTIDIYKLLIINDNMLTFIGGVKNGNKESSNEKGWY